MGRYSEFINFPIYILTEKEVEVPVEEDVDAAEAAETDKKEEAAETDKKEGESCVCAAMHALQTCNCGHASIDKTCVH